MASVWTPYIGTEPYVFISYSHDDWNRVSPVLDAIQRKGFRFWLDRGIQAGDAWTATVSERLADCAVFLAFLSPAFINSNNCLREVRTADSTEKVVTVPLWLEKMDRTTIPPEWVFLLNKTQELRLDEYPTPDAFAEHLLKEQHFISCRAIVPDTGATASVRRRAQNVGQTNVGPSPAFVGREDRMEEIEAAFRSGAAVVDLYGMGGIGKSEICRKLFQTYTAEAGTDLARYVIWVTWQGTIENTFYMQFSHITEQNAKRHWQEIQAFIRKQGRDLLVFLDNADTLKKDSGQNDPEELANLGCRILLTSRTQWEDFYPVYAGNLTQEQCRMLYRSSLRKNIRRRCSDTSEAPDVELDEILRLSAYHALTVHLLAKTQRAADMSYAELLEKLQQSGFDLTDVEEEISYAPSPARRKDGGAEHTFIEHMARIFDLSALREVRNGADALRVLQGMSLLSPNVYLPVKTVRKWLDLPNLKGLNRAVDFGWLNERIEGEDGPRSIAIHPTISAVVRYIDGPDKNYVDAVAGHLYKDMYVDMSEVFCIKLYISEHAVSLDRVAEGMNLQTENYGVMLRQIGYLTDKQGNYSVALGWYQKSLPIIEQVLGTEHPETVILYNNIAFSYNHMSSYSIALKWLKKALNIRKIVFGTEHPEMATTYNTIAYSYSGMGDYAAALQWYQKALRIREKTLGTEHPQTATTYNNIGIVYREIGNYDEALRWMQKALVIRENCHGTEHPYTAQTYHNIGIVFFKKKDYRIALQWLEKALSVREKTLGTDHPYTKATLKWIDDVQNANRQNKQ